MAKNKLHTVVRVRLESRQEPQTHSVAGSVPMESVPCGCHISENHMEAYQEYLDRARKLGYS